MFKPINAARAADKFKSLDELAKRLAAGYKNLMWPAVRALAVKIGDIDRGDKVWWIKRLPHAQALAALLEVPLVDLGLHDAPDGKAFEFATFPELPPISLAREVPCEIGYVDGGDENRGEEKLAFWLAASSPQYLRRSPEHTVSWLKFQRGDGLSFFWAALCARTRHDYISARRLLDVSERLRQPRNLILRIDQACEDVDLIALGAAHPHLNLLIVAPFAAPATDVDAASTWIASWKVLTGQTDRRLVAMKDPNERHEGIARYEWRLHDDWQTRLLEWVEKRIGRATSDSLFTARGVTNWLTSFPRDWQFLQGPADLLAVCRLCHLARETALPHASDVDAGYRLLKLVGGADNALSRRFTSLVVARLEARDLHWRGALTGAQWAALGPAMASVADEATLLEIANGKNVSARRQRAKALSEHILDRGLAPLIQARMLVETRAGTLTLTPQFLVDLVARDRLMQVIRDEPVEHWAMYCHDRERRALVDAALGSMSTDELLAVPERLKTLAAGSLAAIAGAEAMFCEIGKRVCGVSTMPIAFACLADMALPRLATDGFAPRPWTRPLDDDEETLEWIAICWAWSLWRDTPPLVIPVAWAWYFPGWAPELAAVEMPYLYLPEVPEQPVLSNTWQRMTALATQLARRIGRPPEYPPEFLKPMLLVEGLRGRWPVDASWLEAIMVHKDATPTKAAENLLLTEVEKIGPTAAATLLPALMEFVLSDPSDSLRSIFFYRSPIRTWVLQNISLADATSCLTDQQFEALCKAPHTLPRHLLLGMLQNPDMGSPGGLSARLDAVRVLDADHVDTLSSLLATESLGVTAAQQLWKVAPETAERLLGVTSDHHVPASLRLLILLAPVDRTGPVARAILSHVGVLSESDQIAWARQRLPAAGAHAEALGLILGPHIDNPPSPTHASVLTALHRRRTGKGR
jgi:hypothetical protein